MTEPTNITIIPPEAFRAPIVLTDSCQECGGGLGSSFHVIAERRLCDYCFRGRSAHSAHSADIDTDRYDEPAAEGTGRRCVGSASGAGIEVVEANE